MLKVISFVMALSWSLNTLAQSIQSPTEFLGYDIGSQFTRHHEVIDYFEHLEQQKSSQIKLEVYGKTNERRPLVVAILSSEENLKNLEAIRLNNLKNVGLVDGTYTENNIAIVWLSYNVHGNEASSTEAAMITAYKLLT